MATPDDRHGWGRRCGGTIELEQRDGRCMWDNRSLEEPKMTREWGTRRWDKVQ